MTTAVLQKPEQKVDEKTGTWSAIFPNEQVTEVQSALFVKKLLAVAVSNIAYLRAIFPENAFGDRSLEGLNLKILKDDKLCPGAIQVIKWMKGCFDAFDKKYLKMLMIGLYVDPENPDTVIESYTFKFSYENEGGIDIYRNNEKISGAHSDTEIRKATIRLLRTIILLTQTLDSLPDNIMMTMKLLYYDDVTPEDYEPPGFRAADTDNFSFEDEPMTIKVGDVNTAYHSLKVRVKTDKKQFETKNSQVEVDDTASINTEVDTGLDTDIGQEHKTVQEGSQPASGPLKKLSQRLKEPLCSADVPTESPAKPVENAVDTVMSETSQATDTGEEFKVRCPCGCNEDDGLMVVCGVCRYWQHGVCFLILEEEDAPELHLCDVCAREDKEGQEPTDPYLTSLSSLQVQATCLWRRTLTACLELDRIVAHSLATRLGVEVTVAQGLVNRLNKEGFLKPPTKPKKLGRVVDKEKIKCEGLPKYMKKPEKKTSEDVVLEPTETAEVQREPEPIQVDEMETLAEKTESLNLQNETMSNRLSRSKRRNKTEKVSEPKTDNKSTVASKPEGNKKGSGSRKRAFPKNNEDAEFELSSTQDVCEEEPKRRKKSSVPTNAIRV